jgi:hypothetical protein
MQSPHRVGNKAVLDRPGALPGLRSPHVRRSLSKEQVMRQQSPGYSRYRSFSRADGTSEACSTIQPPFFDSRPDDCRESSSATGIPLRQSGAAPGARPRPARPRCRAGPRCPTAGATSPGIQLVSGISRIWPVRERLRRGPGPNRRRWETIRPDRDPQPNRPPGAGHEIAEFFVGQRAGPGAPARCGRDGHGCLLRLSAAALLRYPCALRYSLVSWPCWRFVKLGSPPPTGDGRGPGQHD